ncbi:hypothetical protein, partial [Amycolatopsis lurida]|uniref:hypothetical protein n=1 Tax=Amycolatopsis lurida TaxID=31959 RepID=UPI00364AA90A
SLVWAYAELLLGSNPAVWMYSSGPAFAGVLHEVADHVGDGEQEQLGIGVPPVAVPAFVGDAARAPLTGDR